MNLQNKLKVSCYAIRKKDNKTSIYSIVQRLEENGHMMSPKTKSNYLFNHPGRRKHSSTQLKTKKYK